MTIRRWDVSKDINIRVDNGAYWGRGGTNVRYIGKGTSGEYFRLLMKIAMDFSGMSGGRINSAQLFFTTNEGPAGWEIGSGARLRGYRLTQSFDDDSSDSWSHEAYENPKYDSSKSWGINSGIPTTDNAPFSFDILSYVQRKAPSSVDVLLGTSYVQGKGETDYGFQFRTPDDKNGNYRLAVFSDDSSSPVERRPYVEIDWEPKNTKPDTNWGQPTGATSTGTRYQGTYSDAQGQRIAHAQVQVWRSTDDYPNDNDEENFDNPRWDSGKRASEPSWPDDQYDLDPPASPLPKTSGGTLITYKGRARTWDSADAASDWTLVDGGTFTVLSTSPTVTPRPMGSLSTLQNVRFRAPWTFDPTAVGITSYRVQLTNRFDSGVWGEVLWDKVFVPTAAEQTAKEANFAYEGPSLSGGTSPTGDYSWRIMVTDRLDEESVWVEDNTLHLTQGVAYPDDPNDTTMYGRVGVTTRLVMFAVDEDAQRRPGKVVAIIENPKDLAASGYATTAGQLSFALHNKHPQISAMEPMKTHWSLQQYRGSQWRELTGGLLTDFDATENDTVFTGLDYLGILGLSIEAQAQPDNKPEAQWKDGGAKYYKKTIGYIINDQLKRAVNAGDSPLGFFTRPTGYIDPMSETVSIHSAYAQRLDFIRGLMDSHRGGATGRRSRITARKNPVNGAYEFGVRSNAGKDRPNLVFSFGGLVQAYRVMALGDWGDRVYAVGRLRNQLKPHYVALTAPGIDISNWGEIAKANVWQDVSDVNDLKRRARAMAIEISRAGKRVAMGLRVGGILLLDGWDICDNIQLDIDDGTVDTSLYGTQGWWTVWGWEWRLYPDGHDELTLVTRPREDISDPVGDLIPMDPIHIQPEWTVGHGPPPGVVP